MNKKIIDILNIAVILGSFFMFVGIVRAIPMGDIKIFSASISPETSNASATQNYVVTITNDFISSKKISGAKIAVPLGFSNITGITISGVATDWDSSSSATAEIWVKKTPEGQDIGAGESFTVSFSATAPAIGDNYEWITSASEEEDFNDPSKEFLLMSAQPSVTVSDTTPPVLSLPDDITEEATSPAGATVTYTATATDENPAEPAVNCDTPSDSVFSLGTTTVNCSATDEAGNTSIGSFNVTVQDTTAPTLVVNEGVDTGPVRNDEINISIVEPVSSVELSEYGFSEDDICDGVDLYGNSFSSDVAFAINGDHTDYLCVKTTDSANNTGYLLVGKLNTDNTLPVITVPDSITEETTNSLGMVVDYQATVTDVSDASIALSCLPASGSNFQIGETTVTCSATDTAGNTAEKTFKVTVNLISTNSTGGGGGGGGGNAVSAPELIISNIEVSNISTNSFTITWTTNFSASSYAIYSAEGENHAIDMSNNFGNLPLFGYAHATQELDANPKVTAHTVAVTGLNPLTTYYFRVVSRGSLAVSDEYTASTSAITVVETTSEPDEGQGSGEEIVLATTSPILAQNTTTQIQQPQTYEEPEVVLNQPEAVSEEQFVVENQENVVPEEPSENLNAFTAAGLLPVAQKYFWPLLILLLLIIIAYAIYRLFSGQEDQNQKNRVKK